MRATLLPVLTAALALATAGIALAQLPQQSCTTLALSHTTPSPIPHGETAEVVETVSNTGSFEAIATVRAVLDAPGWSVTPQEAQVTVPAGEQQTVHFEIAPPAEGQEHSISFSVTAQGVCSANGTAGPFQTATASDPVELQWTAPEGYTLPLVGNVPPVYLVGGVAVLGVVVGAALVLGRKGAGLRVRVPEPRKAVAPGASVSFPLELANAATEGDTATLLFSSVPAGWSAFTALPDVRLGARETRTVHVVVRAPADAEGGSAIDLIVEVRSNRAKGPGETVELCAEVASPGQSEEAGPEPA